MARIRQFLMLAVAAAMLSFLLAFSPAQASEKGWEDASDIGRNALVIAAFVIPAAHEDWDGDLQALGSIAAAGIVTQGLKETFPEIRPDGSNRRSFPSGHTSVSFAAAATLHNRYGWKVGIPAQLTAAFVGLARQKAGKHFWHDVLVGAAIGEASGFLITRKKNDRIVIIPFGDTKGGGIVALVRF
ncbi:MAG: phosphatase PAP2 family protein [Sphingorhabdus sp.]